MRLVFESVPRDEAAVIELLQAAAAVRTAKH
jgi:hypothetical protein